MGKSNYVYSLLAKVGNDEVPMSEARTLLRNHVGAMGPEEQKAWRDAAVVNGRRLMTIAEAFAQEMTVIASEQFSQTA